MNITFSELTERFRNAWKAVIGKKEELTEIDSRFGDADHGITMEKIAEAAISAIDEGAGSPKQLLDGMASAVMTINGGSAVPLWYTYLDRLSQGAPEKDSLSAEELKTMFDTGLKNLSEISGAKVGDKTMMDALIPATQAMDASAASAQELFLAAAEAAEKGTELTKNFASRFGRARSYGDQTIGTPDAGAVSMTAFLRGLAEKTA